MKIQQNLDVQINPFQNQNNESSVAGAGKAGQKNGNLSAESSG